MSDALRRADELSTLRNQAGFSKKLATAIKLTKHIISKSIDYYFLYLFIEDEIHNDLGSSKTVITRKGKKITKTALKGGQVALQDEITWYERMKDTKFKQFIPKIYCFTKRWPARIEMKYYTYPNMRKIIREDMNTLRYLTKRWKYLIEHLKDDVYSQQQIIPPSDFVIKNHFEKTNRRLEQAKTQSDRLLRLIDKDQVTINRERYHSYDKIKQLLTNSDEVIDRLTPDMLSLIHGDLHTNNILCGLSYKKMILLDCRGRSPYGIIQNDYAYDVAKIIHDFEGKYSLIERNEYSLFMSGEVVEYEYSDKSFANKLSRLALLLRELIDDNFADDELWYRAEFIEAMLFLSMTPLHMKKESEAILCFCTGVEKLNQWMKRYHPSMYELL